MLRFDRTLRRVKNIRKRDASAELYDSPVRRASKHSEFPAECIVFSKDRAFQLHALLSSCTEMVTPGIPIHVLYHTSAHTHRQAYDEVIKIFLDNSNISFTKQHSDTSFRHDLMLLLRSVESENIFFLVDDVVFIEEFDIKDFSQFNTDTFVPTLRMGLNLTDCYTLREKQPLPVFTPGIIKDKDKITWHWHRGSCDWAYPVSLDGHLFSTREITTMIQSIDFSAPNTLEDRLQKFRRFFLSRMGVGYKKSKIVNIPCNKVQTENKNLCGDIHQDYLLEQWNRGLQMDYRSLYGFYNVSAHQEIPFKYKKRS